MAEWLRRLTRNQIPSGSVGSNPTDCEKFCAYIPPSQKLSPIETLYEYKCQHRWFSGRMLACHAGGPGSIPGRCSRFLETLIHFIE